MENQNRTILISAELKEFRDQIEKALEGFHANIITLPNDGRLIYETIKLEKPDIVFVEDMLTEACFADIIEKIRSEMPDYQPFYFCAVCFRSENYDRRLIGNGVRYIFDLPLDTNNLAYKMAYYVSGGKPELSYLPSQIKGLYRQGPWDMESLITKAIQDIGIPAHIKGYRYLRDAITLVAKDYSVIGSVTKVLYPEVAKMNDTTPTRVERAIRHAIETAWDRGDVDILGYYFGYTIQCKKGKPTNSEFIAMIADKIRLELKASSF